MRIQLTRASAVAALTGCAALTAAAGLIRAEGPAPADAPVRLDAAAIAQQSHFVPAIHIGGADAPAGAPSLKTAVWSEYIDGLEPVFVVLDPSGRLGVISPEGAWFLPEGAELPAAVHS